MSEAERQKVNSSPRMRNPLLLALSIAVSCYLLSAEGATQVGSKRMRALIPPPPYHENLYVTIAGGIPQICNDAAGYLQSHGIQAGCEGSLSYSLDVPIDKSIQAIHLLRSYYTNSPLVKESGKGSSGFVVFVHPLRYDPPGLPEAITFHSLLDHRIKPGMSKKRVAETLKNCGLTVWIGPSDWSSAPHLLQARQKHGRVDDEWRPTAVFYFDPVGRMRNYIVLCYYYPKQTSEFKALQ